MVDIILRLTEISLAVFCLWTTHPPLRGPPSLTREGFIETEMPLSKYNLFCTDINKNIISAGAERFRTKPSLAREGGIDEPTVRVNDG